MRSASTTPPTTRTMRPSMWMVSTLIGPTFRPCRGRRLWRSSMRWRHCPRCSARRSCCRPRAACHSRRLRRSHRPGTKRSRGRLRDAMTKPAGNDGGMEMSGSGDAGASIAATAPRTTRSTSVHRPLRAQRSSRRRRDRCRRARVTRRHAVARRASQSNAARGPRPPRRTVLLFNV